MNFRLMLLTSGLLTGTVLGSGCTREELAPWFPQGLEIECRDVPPATLGQSYTFDLMVTGGVDPLTIEVTGLPAGLTVNADGIISGTPTEEGSFDFTVTVTDADGNVREFADCGDLVVALPDEPTIQCVDDSGSIPDGFVDVAYTYEVTAPGGAAPYEWSVTGLPPGFELVPNGTSATISGTATAVGTFDVEITVTDASGVVTDAQCGELIIRDPISVDPNQLLEAFPDGCVPLGVTLDDLLKAGILFGGDNTAISCDFVPGRGNGDRKWDGTNSTQPPGLVLDSETCAWGGTVSPNLPFGIYAYITTFTQSGQKAFVPHCAPQEMQAPTAYDVLREDTGTESTFKARPVFVDPFDPANPEKKWEFGTDVDPQVTVTDDVGACAGNTCFYSFVFAYNALSSKASVSANPNSKFPVMGFDGFKHAVQISDVSIETFRGRAYVANIQFDYCIADNSDDCGNGVKDVKEYTSEERAALVKMNGGGSNYYFSLVLLPAN